MLGEPLIAFATPSLPRAPTPVGHGTDFETPTVSFYDGLSLER